MKNKQCQYSRIKHQLNSKRERGLKYVIWSLTPDMADFVVGTLGYSSIPYIYRISTRFIPREARTSALLKEIHFSKKQGKSRLFKKLNPGEKKLLEEHGIFFVPLKYKIMLQA